MKTFIEWLPDDEQKSLEEGLGRNLLAYGLMGAAALGAGGCSGGKCATPQTAPQAGQVEKFSNYMDRTKDMHGKQKADEWKKRMARKQAEQQKGTPKELGNEKYTAPNAGDYL
jgi:hypothetical protein